MTSLLFVPGTNSALGLDATTDMIQQQGRHHDGVPVVAIFLTDGRSKSQTRTELAAKNLHEMLPEVKVSPNTRKLHFTLSIVSHCKYCYQQLISDAEKCTETYTSKQ